MDTLRQRTVSDIDRAALVARAVVFFSGMVLMAVQVSSGRLMARHVGQSLYSWTAIIGVMLGGMALGNGLGGRLAERARPDRTLCVLLVLCAAAVLGLLPLNAWAGSFMRFSAVPWSLRVAAHVAAVLAVLSVLMGMVDPVATHWAASRSRHRAVVFSSLYAWGVAGNGVGVLLTGYVLLAHWNVSTIVSVAAVAFALLAVITRLATANTAVADVSMAAQTPMQKQSAVETQCVRWLPWSMAFMAGFSLMAMELAASRILAREFGYSLYVWTSVIGVFFGGMILGMAVIGRWLANGSMGRSALILACAAIGCPLALLGHARLATWLPLWGVSWPLRVGVHAGIVFLGPAMMLGGCMAIAVRLRLGSSMEPDRVKREGRLGLAIGGLYAWVSAGSVVGVLLTGFLLMEKLGMRGVVLLAGGMPAVALTVWGIWTLVTAQARYGSRALALAVWLLFWIGLTAAAVGWGPLADFGAVLGVRDADDPFVLYRDESAYFHIEVRQEAYQPARRHLYLDKLKHSIVDERYPTDLHYPYERIYAAVLEHVFGASTPLRALALGGGGYTFVRHVARTRPGSDLEAIELDPAVTRAAKAAMMLDPDPGFAITHGDAGRIVRDRAAQATSADDAQGYDAVFSDAINDFSVPAHMTTREFFEAVRQVLRPGGMVLMTVIDTHESGRFVRAVAETCARVFEDVAVFATHRNGTGRDTFVVVGSQRAWETGVAFPGTPVDVARLAEWGRRAGAMILTDDYTPVEHLLAPVVRTRRPAFAEVRFMQAARLYERRRYAASLAACRDVLAADPAHIAAHDLLALNLAVVGRLPEAVAVWENALEQWPDLPSLHNNLGYAYDQMGNLPAAMVQWEHALRLDPTLNSARLNLESARARLITP